jgi:2-iminobutanoate/2-iminopropanoate deaminase
MCFMAPKGMQIACRSSRKNTRPGISRLARKEVSYMDFFTLPEDGAERFPFSHAVICNGFLFVAGQLAQDEPGWSGPADIEAETRMAMDRIGRILTASGAGFADIVRVGVFMTNLDEFDRMNTVYRTYFTAPHFPVRTCVGVARLLRGGSIEIDCIARLPAVRP